MISKISKKWFSTKTNGFFFQKKDINPCILNAQYAVRGIVPTKANQIQSQIKQNPKHKYPFNQITYCNIGNPQFFHQPPISFNRRVLSCLLNPQLLNSKQIHNDVKKRAKFYLDNIISAGSYTHSLGIEEVRHSVANYIARQDSVSAPDINNIFLTEGASQGVHMVLQALISSVKDGIMIPIPQYPLYSASVALNGGSIVPYYLNEERGWQLDIEEAQKALQISKNEGKTVRAIVVINPGNPTGAIFNNQTIEKIIRFSVKNKLIIIADQVYRENIYKENTKFTSFRKVLNTLSHDLQYQCELVSLNSVSKGLLGECGLRGGYMQLYNINSDVQQQLVKLKSIFLCSNSVGQCTVELMCNPPTTSDISEQIKSQYLKQRNSLYNSLKNRAQLVTKALNKMRNIKCQQVEGAMYAFPSIIFSKKVHQVSNGKADLYYCLELLQKTGIAVVPGSGFKQRDGTNHFRITTLILPQQKLNKKLQDFYAFNEQFHKRFE